ncbi:hypothetical protein JCM8547_006037 [Rhodosporidiobolus lusitaniae]
MPSLLDLPPELLEPILEEATVEHYPVYYGNVSPALCAVARPIFFRRVRITPRRDGCRMVRLLRLFEASPSVAPCVRRLDLDFEKLWLTRETAPLFVKTVETVLSRLPNLDHLELASKIAPAVFRSSSTRALSPSLRVLVIEGEFELW